MDKEKAWKEINRVEKIEVKDRTQSQHLYLIKYKYTGSVRNYLLSMGAFIK